MGLLMRTTTCVLFFASSLVVACTGESVGPPPKPPVGSLEPVAVADAGLATVTAKERGLADLYVNALSSSAEDAGAPFARLEPLLNRDLAEFSSPAMPPAHGPAGIMAAHDALFGAFEDRKGALTRVWRTPDEQSLEWVMTGKQARDWMGIAATHKSVTFKGLTLLWTKDDGTIVDIHVYFDVGLLKAQLTGAGPKEILALPAPALPTGPAQIFEQTGAESTNEQGNVTVVKSWLSALESDDAPNYLAPLTDTTEILTLERAAPLKGKDTAKKYFTATHNAIGQLDTTVNNAWGVAEFAIVEYDLDGEQLGPFSWIPLLASMPTQTMQLAHFDLVDICEIEEGKIARVWRYDSPSQVLRDSASASKAYTHAVP
jgi:hypothetical protein